MEIIRSRHMGLCFGVSEAIDKCYNTIEIEKNKKRIYILGMLVHNEHVVNKLKTHGFITIEEEDLLSEKILLNSDDIVIIRAHGTTKEIYNILHEKQVKIYDTTCSFVSNIRNILIEMEDQGYKILFIGDKNHPEVTGIASFGRNINIFKDLDELKKSDLDKDAKYAVLTQTTLNKKLFLEIEKYLKNSFQNIKIFDRICGATQVRQKAAEELAKKVEIVIIIGGKNSSNTKKLYDICKKINDKSYFVQVEDDLDRSWFEGCNKIGITAGASTPEEIIVNIENKIKGDHIMSTNDNYEEFETLLQDYLPTEENLKIKVTGSISQKDRNYVYLDVPGQRTSVRIKADELEGFEKGDEVEVLLLGETDDGDFLIGSRRRILIETGNENIDKSFENKEPITIKITKKVKGGYIAEHMEIQGFLPNSLSEISKFDENDAEGKELKVIVRDINAQKGQKGRKITFSRKDLVNKEIDKEFATIQIGDIVECEISKVLDFGISVVFGALRGFIHISEISWKKLNKIADQYKAGDKVKAKIVSIEPEKKNIKLSMKELEENPWEIAAKSYQVDSIVDGIVTRIMKYGVFVQIMEGVDGLVHISDFTWNKKRINLDEFIKLEDKIKVKILYFMPSERKLKLGIKQLSEDPWNTVGDRYTVGTILDGIVAGIKPFGIFVEVEPGVDVFIHQSDFQWQDEKSKKFQKGDKVEFIITDVNIEENKIKGSIKNLTKNPWELAMESIKVGQTIEREIKTIMDFGLFINIVKGVDGFIPVQLASKEFVKDIKEKFKEGQVVKAQIIDIDTEKQRIKLSIKKIEIEEEKRENQELLDKYGTSGGETE
ncbi:MAG: 4-hydroxy-3-methylbut-2-enyl diphosphate reductase [Fusobacteriaceae bacterium]|jgi:4-hydroxy-3-methylbut-2-enyl diphosphate reductase|nr:4-hydroxy-3-methylbut-2-enyl diphosphate reductase [Fusobacteriaceae bacterium]